MNDNSFAMNKAMGYMSGDPEKSTTIAELDRRVVHKVTIHLPEKAA